MRSFTLKDGNRIREQLLTLSDREYKSTYCIVEATVPLQRYVATVTLKPVTDGDRTFWHWESTFATPPGQERELREMVARDVYEAGFENLRRYLRDGGDRRGAGGAPLPTALPMPSRRAVVRHYGGPDMLQPDDGEAAAPEAGEVRIRQRAIGVNFIDVYLQEGLDPGDAAAARRAGHGGGGHAWSMSAPGVSGLLPGDRVAYLGPPARRLLQRAHRAGRLGGAPAGGGGGRRRRGDPAQGHHRRLPAARPRPGRAGHAAPGPRRGRRRRPARLLLGAPARRHRDRHGVERGQGARRARIRLRVSDRRRRPSLRRGGAARFGGADVVIDGIGDAAREENFAALARRGHWISLGQASGALQPLSADRLVEKSITFSRPVVFDYVASPADLAARAGRVWQALADGTLKAPPIERHALGAADEAHRRLESRRTIGALVLVA